MDAHTYAGIDDLARGLARARFDAAVSRGHLMPLVIPYSLAGAFIAPILWLTVPQARYPWVYHTRWPLLLFIVFFNVTVALSTSSGNFAVSYATGLMASWGIVYNFNLLLWTRPQRDAKRIVLRRLATRHEDGATGMAGNGNPPEYRGAVQMDSNAETWGVRRRRNSTANTTAPESEISQHLHHQSLHRQDLGYFWEGFPAEGTFAHRLNWVFDLSTSFRGCGWNWAISSVPRPRPPQNTEDPELERVDFSDMPKTSKTGFTRCLTSREYHLTKARTIIFHYLLIDFLATFMALDPYFVFGPDSPHFVAHPVPPHLASLPPLLLLWLRQLMSLAGFISAIIFIMSLNALAQYHLLPHLLHPATGAPFQYPSIYGSFTNVLSRGLNGWWGGWWHQTFRAQFLAPATWLRREGYTRSGSPAGVLLALAVSFAQSAFMHMFGSLTALPETRLWRAPLFFGIQPVGIVLQHGLSVLARRAWPRVPGRLARAANLATTLLWVQWTSRWFCDDVASTGLWLCDPLPFSLVRMLGFGLPGDRWWRWDRYDIPNWYTGRYWWQSGVAI